VVNIYLKIFLEERMCEAAVIAKSPVCTGLFAQYSLFQFSIGLACLPQPNEGMKR
jgi:hypothetical protein